MSDRPVAHAISAVKDRVARRLGLWALTFACAVVSVDAVRGYAQPVVEVDEVAVLLATYYFRLAFVLRDFDSPDWHHSESLNHPPFWKYVFGAVYTLHGTEVTSTSPKERWASLAVDERMNRQMMEELRRDYSPSVRWPGRLVSSLAIAASAWLLFVIVRKLFSPTAAVFTLVAFALNPTVRWVSTKGLVDGLLLLLILAALALGLSWIRAIQAGKRSWPIALSIGAILGALFNTKITGIMSTLALGLLGAVWAWRAPRDQRRTILGSTLLALASSFVFWIALNPSLWRHPLSFAVDLFLERRAYVTAQVILFQDAALKAPMGVVATFVDRCLFRLDPIFHPLRVPVFALLFFLGAAAAARACTSKHGGAARWMRVWFVMTGAVWCVAAAYSYRLDWSRYTLPALWFVCATIGVGFESLVEAIKSRTFHRRQLVPAAVLCGVTVGVAFIPERHENRNTVSYKQWEADAIARLLQEGRFESPVVRNLLEDKLLMRDHPTSAVAPP